MRVEERRLLLALVEGEVRVVLRDARLLVGRDARALEPLGYHNNMEHGEAGGFNDGKNTDFWIDEQGAVTPTHVAFEAKSKDEVAAFYERISRKTRDILARQAIEATAVEATLELPATAAAGSTIQVTWSGPDYEKDYLAVAEPDAEQHVA